MGERTITHVEFLHAPGERQLAQELFGVLGCRVVDRGGTFFTSFVEPEGTSWSSNVFYASEVTDEQWAFELSLRERAGASLTSFVDTRRGVPQRSFHCGFRVPDEPALLAVVDRVERAATSGPLAGRVAMAGVFRPGDPGALAPNMVQAFVWTDAVACGLLALGQFIEVQWHLDS
jgi:hypothetical protein